MAATIDQIQADAAKLADKVKSLTTKLTGLQQSVTDLQTQIANAPEKLSPETQAKMDAVFASLEASNAELDSDLTP